ncbi:fatty-acyl-CoA synthase [Pseudonocardia sediminis]|uniref:Fatty-acyl-CoA synthase n=1 Tax=Pseudonocardia sediminis TaxID=1397368 RepID=A0A4Q7UR19_PSEST|nr:long-chain-fatty-acid--CoA ligase [Pseudonocardia sediminis]RZT84016.1 fatty-acyl-CoA synthase [Pseudonocardia sediminis]
MQGLMFDSQLLLHSLLWRTERLFAEKQIITRLGPGEYHRYTYRDFGKRARRLGDALRTLGVEPGDRVGTLAWNHWRHLEAYFGVPGIQGVLHTINLRLSPSQQKFTIDKAEDRFLLVDTDQLPGVAALFELGLSSVEAVVVLDDAVPAHDLPVPVHAYEDLLAVADEDAQFSEFDEKTASAMCFTSATTGDPKGVVYSHRAMVLQAMCLAMHDKLNMAERQIWLEVAPMFHCNGWNIPHTALLQGATLVLPGAHPTPGDYVDIIEDLGVTGMNAAVTIGTMIRDAVRSSDRERDLSTLDTLWLGGQAPSKAVMKWFRDTYDTEVMQGYGMTENSPQICFFALKSTLEDGSDDEIYSLRQTQGLPIPLLQIKVVDPVTGEEQPWDGESIGDFHVRSPFTASEYYRDERTKDSIVDGWLRTGDVGCIDPEGYVLLKDRSKDLIKSGGEWISTIDLENALMLHGGVAEATVVGISDEKWLERPLGVVVASDPALTAEDLRAHLLGEGFAKFWVPDEFLFVSEVPKTSVGKFDKKAIRGVVADDGVAGARERLLPS